MIARLALLFLVGATLLFSAPAALAGRLIVVNGEALSVEQIAVLDAVACTLVPSGRYWLMPNGAWGYEGVPIQAGFLGEQCHSAPAPARRKSLSERGLLYSPGELLR